MRFKMAGQKCRIPGGKGVWISAACYASNVHDRTRESTAHDSGDGIDFYFRVTMFFPVIMDAAVYRTTKLRRGMEASKAFKLQDYHKILWAYSDLAVHSPKGRV